MSLTTSNHPEASAYKDSHPVQWADLEGALLPLLVEQLFQIEAEDPAKSLDFACWTLSLGVQSVAQDWDKLQEKLAAMPPKDDFLQTVYDEFGTSGTERYLDEEDDQPIHEASYTAACKELLDMILDITGEANVTLAANIFDYFLVKALNQVKGRPALS